jgi:Trk-type K+ transport system membrane component
MLPGRLEMFTLLALFMPGFWRNRSDWNHLDADLMEESDERES